MLYGLTCVFFRSFLSARGLMNIGTLVFLALSISMLFMGYPVLSEFYFNSKDGKKGGFGLGGTNGSGQIPDVEKLVSQPCMYS